MTSDIIQFITKLQKSNLSAGCPHCSHEFTLSEALLFNGLEPFPEKAEAIKLEWQKVLDNKIAELKNRQISADTKSEKQAIASGMGKIVEKIISAHKDFMMSPADCRFLGEPIDMIVFNGLSENKINQITFLDIKTGNAPLNTHQRRIRDAIEDNNVKWKVF